ncbi:MAG: endonuclease/exonuclease/phosphatase family protein [Candidatus Heimdallarchaeota archaeon]|nr:endonuclease/exonuclease/phosphatase family protein [Candidatus Heimdallarchaeota archaeon]
MNENEKNVVMNGILYGILLYFMIQSISTLVMSVYLLELLNTSLDAKALGILFMFSSIAAIWIKPSKISLNAAGFSLILFRILYPYFSTPIKLLLSGIAVAGAWILLPILIMLNKSNREFATSIMIGTLFSAILSVTSKTLGYSADITEYGIPSTTISGILLAGLAGFLLYTYQIPEINEENQKEFSSFSFVLGFVGVLGLLYFVYYSPVILTRWSEANYTLVIIIFSLMMLITSAIILFKDQFLEKISITLLGVWNVLFMFTLIYSILLNQVEFISTYPSGAIIISQSSMLMKAIVYINLILSPVIFLNIGVLSNSLVHNKCNRKGLALSFFFSSIIFVLIIFMLIFSNTWGYVEPVSPLFRGMMWIPFFFLGIMMIYPLIFGTTIIIQKYHSYRFNKQFILLFLLLATTSIASVSLLSFNGNDSSQPTEIRVMTYNIQQFADADGEVNFENQLQLIKDKNVDIIGLQESDTTKISTGNIDVVRYFADQLGFYSYYGPKSVMQTYGVALLSRWPISDPNTFYTMGDEDEIGSIYAKIELDDITLNIFVNHPAGSDYSKMSHTNTMLNLAKDLENVILLGDFNWRQDTVYYSMVTSFYVDTWRYVYPTGIDSNNLNMSSSIDHIFVSDTFGISGSTYIPSPESETDHPVYWTDLTW